MKNERSTLRGAGKWLATLVLGSVLLLAGTGQVQAADTASAKPLRVGVSPIFPPMIFKQGKEIVGVEVDLARELGKYLQRPVTFVEVPWEDQIEALLGGKIDIIMSSMSITSSRRFLVNFTEPYMTVGQMGLVRRERVNDFLFGLPLRSGTSVGVIKGTTGDFLAQRDFPKAKRKTYSSGDDAANAVTKKRLDVFIGDSTLIWYLAATHASEGLTVLRQPLSEEYLAWAVRKTDDALLKSANEFILQARKDDALLKTAKRWMAVSE